MSARKTSHAPAKNDTHISWFTPFENPWNPGLYLRLPADHGEIYRHTQRLLQVFEGPLPVYLRFADTGKLVRTPSNWWVNPPSVLIEELKRLLGEDNVVLLK